MDWKQIENYWEAALERAAKECPYREAPDEDEPREGDERPADDDREAWNARYDEDYQRVPWTTGFAMGFLGVPPDEVEEPRGRYYWQGYEAGEAARQK